MKGDNNEPKPARSWLDFGKAIGGAIYNISDVTTNAIANPGKAITDAYSIGKEILDAPLLYTLKSHYISGLLQSVEPSDIIGILSKIPGINSYILGIEHLLDKDALPILSGLIKKNPEFLRIIENKYAEIIEHPENTKKLTKELVDLTIKLVTGTEQQESIKLAKKLIDNISIHMLSDEFEKVRGMDFEIRAPETTKERREELIAQQEEEVSKLSLAGSIAFALRDYANIASHFMDEKFLSSVLTDSNSQELSKITGKFIDLSFATDQRSKNADFQAVVEAIVDLISKDEVEKVLTPLATRALVTAIFELPNTETIAIYKTLVEDLANDQVRFQALFSSLVQAKDDTNKKVTLKQCLRETIAFIQTPPPPEYIIISRETSELKEGQVGIFKQKDGQVMYKKSNEDAKPLILNENSALREKISKTLDKNQARNSLEDMERALYSSVSFPLKLSEDEVYQLYAVTHETESDNLNSLFDTELNDWIRLATSEDLVHHVLDMTTKNQHIFENICALPQVKNALQSNHIAENAEDMVEGVIESKPIQNNLTQPQKNFYAQFKNMRKSKRKEKQAEIVASAAAKQKFAKHLKTLVDTINKVNSPGLTKGIKDNAESIGNGIDFVISRSEPLTTTFALFGMKGKDIVELLPSLTSEKGLKTLSSIVEDGSVKNVVKAIVSLAMHEPKILQFAIKYTMTYVKNRIIGLEIPLQEMGNVKDMGHHLASHPHVKRAVKVLNAHGAEHHNRERKHLKTERENVQRS